MKTKTRVVNIHRGAREYVYVGRPSRWGNPFSHRSGTKAEFRVATREEALDRYREWVLSQPELVAAIRRELRGKVLGCHCKPKPCHADILAEIADSEPG